MDREDESLTKRDKRPDNPHRPLMDAIFYGKVEVKERQAKNFIQGVLANDDAVEMLIQLVCSLCHKPVLIMLERKQYSFARCFVDL
jgi:hypothetical protein